MTCASGRAPSPRADAAPAHPTPTPPPASPSSAPRLELRCLSAAPAAQALVTSLDPLRVYLLGTGIPKVSQWNYSKAVEDVKEPCIHVLMPGTNECFQNKRANVLTPYPTRTNTQEWFDKARLRRTPRALRPVRRPPTPARVRH